MKQLSTEAGWLFKEAKELKLDLLKYNSGTEQSERKPLITLAAVAGDMARGYASLSTELTKRHERNQLHGI